MSVCCRCCCPLPMQFSQGSKGGPRGAKPSPTVASVPWKNIATRPNQTRPPPFLSFFWMHISMVSVLLSASVERFGVSRLRDFYNGLCLKDKPWFAVYNCLQLSWQSAPISAVCNRLDRLESLQLSEYVKSALFLPDFLVLQLISLFLSSVWTFPDLSNILVLWFPFVILDAGHVHLETAQDKI